MTVHDQHAVSLAALMAQHSQKRAYRTELQILVVVRQETPHSSRLGLQWLLLVGADELRLYTQKCVHLDSCW